MTTPEQEQVVTAKRPMPPGGLRVRNMLMVAHGFEHIISNFLPPLFVFIHNDLGFSYTQLGVIVAVASITSAFFQLPAGLLVDRLGPKRVLLGGYLFTFVGLFLLSRSNLFPMFVLAQVIYGIGYATYHPASFTDVARVSQRSGLGMGMAMHDVGGNLGAAAGYSISAFLATWFGWRNAIGSIVMLGVFWVVVFSFLYPDDGRPSKPPARIPREEDVSIESEEKQPSFESWLSVALVALVALLAAIFGIGAMAFFPTFFVTTRGVSPAIAGLFSTILMLSGAGGSLVGGGLGDRYDRPRIMLLSAILTTSIVYILVRISVSTPVLIILIIALGFSQCMARPCLDATVSEISPVGRSGSTYGIVFGVVALGGAAAGPLVGYLTDQYSIGLGFTVISVSFLLHGILIYGFRNSSILKKKGEDFGRDSEIS